MSSKISVIGIVKDHIATLRNNRTGKIHFPDIVLFFIFPGIISGLMLQLGVSLNDGFVNALITSFSIFSALLFNLLLLVYDISDKLDNKPQGTNIAENNKIIIRRELLREIYVNVSFSILISMTVVIILLSYFLKPSNCVLFTVNVCSAQWILALIVYYLSSQFLLTLFMVLKRIYRLLAKAFDTKSH